MNKLQETFQGFKYMIEVLDNGEPFFFRGYFVDENHISHKMFSSDLSNGALFSPLSFKARKLLKEIKKENPSFPARLRRILPLKQHISGKFETKG